MSDPFVKVGHRHGNVFLRVLHTLAGHRVATLVKLSPKEAKAIAEEIADAAMRAAGEHKTKAKRLKIARKS